MKTGFFRSSETELGEIHFMSSFDWISENVSPGRVENNAFCTVTSSPSLSIKREDTLTAALLQELNIAIKNIQGKEGVGLQRREKERMS